VRWSGGPEQRESDELLTHKQHLATMGEGAKGCLFLKAPSGIYKPEIGFEEPIWATVRSDKLHLPDPFIA